MKIKLKELKIEHINVLSRRVSYYHQYLNFATQTEQLKKDYVSLSIITDLQFKIMKKAIDPKIEDHTSLSFNLHNAFILQDALLYSLEEDVYNKNLQLKLIENINMQLPTCSDLEI